MKDNVIKKARIGRRIGSIVSFVWIFVNLLMFVKLFLEKRYYSGTGWAIILAISIFFAYLYYWTPRTSKKQRTRHKITSKCLNAKQAKKDEDFVLLFSTKDNIKMGRIKEALRSNGIECIVLDQHSAVMMSFLPDIEMRIMVRTEDFESSMRVVKDLIEQNVERGLNNT